MLTQLLGLPYPEAAEVCGCPVGTIRSRVARARADLVEGLADGAAGRREPARPRLSPSRRWLPVAGPAGRASGPHRSAVRRSGGPVRTRRTGADACPSA